MHREITTIDLQQELETHSKAVVIDVRTYGEILLGVVPGALHIDLFGPDFLERIKTLDKDLTYFIICRSGNRSDSVAEAMANMGFPKVFNVLGGMIQWNGEIQYPQENTISRSA